MPRSIRVTHRNDPSLRSTNFACIYSLCLPLTAPASNLESFHSSPFFLARSRLCEALSLFAEVTFPALFLLLYYRQTLACSCTVSCLSNIFRLALLDALSSFSTVYHRMTPVTDQLQLPNQSPPLNSTPFCKRPNHRQFATALCLPLKSWAEYFLSLDCVRIPTSRGKIFQ